MDLKKVATGLGVASGIFGVVGGLLSICQTADQMIHGVKLRDDQLDSLGCSISNKLSNSIVFDYDALASQIIEEAKKTNNIK